MTAAQITDSIVARLLECSTVENIYTEQMEQGFKRPCFFVSTDVQEQPLMNERAEQAFSVRILWYPVKGGYTREDSQDMAEWLSSALEWIDVEKIPKRVDSMKYECRDKDGTLVFQTGYRTHIRKQKPQTKMGTLSVESRTLSNND